jgi:hypothetical protein
MDRIKDFSEDDLYARLGQFALAAREPGVTSDSLIWKDGNSFDQLRELGRRVFAAWGVALHSLICSDQSDAIETRNEIRAALMRDDKSAGAVIVAVALTRYLGVDVATSTVIGLLAYQVVLKPLGQEFCRSWQSSIDREPKGGA